MARALARAGFRTRNIGYATLRAPLALIVERLAVEIDRVSTEPDGAGGERARVGFVVHSLGGLVVRAYAQAHGTSRIARVVMLATPNGGSEVVDRLRRHRWLTSLLGPTASLLGTGRGDLPAMLGPLDFEAGVIAGNVSFNPVFSPMLPGENDGTVTVERTRAEGMRDFLVVPHSHTFLMNAPEVQRQAIAFLHNGRFERR